MVQVFLRRELRLPAMPDLPFVLCALFTCIFGIFLLLCSPWTKITLCSSEARSGSTRWGSWSMVKRSVCVSSGVSVDFEFEVVRLQGRLRRSQTRTLFSLNFGANITALDPSSERSVSDVRVLVKQPHLVRQLRLYQCVVKSIVKCST